MRYAVLYQVVDQCCAKGFLEKVHRVIRMQVHKLPDLLHREFFRVVLSYETRHLPDLVEPGVGDRENTLPLGAYHRASRKGG